MQITLDTVREFLNMTLIKIGNAPVTLGGILTGICVFVASLFVSSIVQRMLSTKLSKKMNLSSGLVYALRRILHYLILCLGFVLAAQCVGLNLGSLAVVFGFLSVGIGFGLQNITSNFISGLILLIERPVSVGDFVYIEGEKGWVKKISMRSTVIVTVDNISIIVPNSKFIEDTVTNWSFGDTRIRIHCPVGVAYGSDIEKVKTTLLKVAENHPDVLADPAPSVFFNEFGDSSLNMDLLVWSNSADKQVVIKSDINYAIDAAFRAAGIEIPFPQQDLHLQMTSAIDRLADNK